MRDKFSALPALTKGTLEALIVNAGGVVLVLGLQLFLAQLLGVEHYGLYSLVISWLSIFVLICGLGSEGALLRFLPEYVSNGRLDELKYVVTRYAIAALVLSVLFALLLASFGPTFSYAPSSSLAEGEFQDAFFLGAILLPIWVLLNGTTHSLRALKKIFYSRLPDMILRPGVMLLLLGLVCLLHINALITTSAALLFHVLATVFALWFALSKLQQKFTNEKSALSPVTKAERRSALRDWVDVSSAMFLLAGAQVILNQLDTVMLGFFRDTAEVGVYSLAVRFSAFSLFGLQAVNAIAAPMISEIYADKGREELQYHISKVVVLIAVLSLPIFVGLILFGGRIVGYFGSDFSVAYTILLILLLGQGVNCLLGPIGFIVSLTGHHRRSVRVLLFTLAINFVVNIPAIYWFGMYGAALTTAFCIALRNILLWREAKAEIEVDSSLWFGCAYLYKKGFLRG